MANNNSLENRLQTVLAAGDVKLSTSAVYNPFAGQGFPTNGSDTILPGEDNISIDIYTMNRGTAEERKVASVGYRCASGRILTASTLFGRGHYILGKDLTEAKLRDLVGRTSFKTGSKADNFGKPSTVHLADGDKPIFVFTKDCKVTFGKAAAQGEKVFLPKSNSYDATSRAVQLEEAEGDYAVITLG